MADLSGQTIASSYEQLLSLPDGGGNANTLVAVTDGDAGTTFGIKLATNKVEIIPGSNDTNAFEVSQADGTAVLTVDSTNALVGVGAAPASGTADPLQITTPASGGGQGLSILRTDNNASQLIGRITAGNSVDAELASITFNTDGANDSGNIIFNTEATGGSLAEAMRINSSGVVGIGVTPDDEWDTFTAMQIGETGAIFAHPDGTGAGSAIHITANAYYDSQYEYLISASDEASRYTQENGKHLFYTAPAGTHGNAITFTEIIEAQSSQIKFTVPTFKLSETDGDANAGPIFILQRDNSASEDNGDVLGEIQFQGSDSANTTTTEYSTIHSRISNVSNTVEEGTIVFKNMVAGTSTEVMTLKGSALGIGTGDAVDEELHVEKSQNTLTRIKIENTNTGSSAQAQTNYVSDKGEFNVGIVSDAHSLDGAAILSNTANSDMFFACNNAEVMRIKADGKVGIDTSNPQRDFVISNGGAGGIEFGASDSTNVMSVFNRQTSSYPALQFEASSFTFAPQGGGLIIDSDVNDPKHFEIRSSNDIAHGMTDFDNTATFFKVQKASNDTGGANMACYSENTIGLEMPIRVTNEISSASPSLSTQAPFQVIVQKKNSSSVQSLDASKTLVAFRNNDGTRFIFDSEGRGYASNSFNSTYSDLRLKKDVVDIPYGLETINKLKPKKYVRYAGDMKDGEVVLEGNGWDELGFIAQDVKELIPEVIANPTCDETKGFYVMDDTQITSILVKAVQELSAKVEQLENKLGE